MKFLQIRKADEVIQEIIEKIKSGEVILRQSPPAATGPSKDRRR